MKTFVCLACFCALLCGCAPADPVRALEQKSESYTILGDKRDDDSMTVILRDQSALGWEVTGAAFDSKRDRLIVFYKKVK